MSRVDNQTYMKLVFFMADLPEEAKSKCAICNETLTHVIKKAEAETGAPTATIAKALSEEINACALPGDRVTAEQLRNRARRHSGEISKRSNRPNNDTPTDQHKNEVDTSEDPVLTEVINRLKEIHNYLNKQVLNSESLWRIKTNLVQFHINLVQEEAFSSGIDLDEF